MALVLVPVVASVTILNRRLYVRFVGTKHGMEFEDMDHLGVAVEHAIEAKLNAETILAIAEFVKRQ